MLLKIKIYPDPILRQKAKPIKEITLEIRRLITDLKETMVKKDGAGLAANQVGQLKQIVAVMTDRGARAFLNPKIVCQSRQKITNEEGCLSFPDIWLKIKRAEKIKMEAIDESGKKIIIDVSGILAVILSHEIDHLNGVLFIDRISFLQKMKIARKLNSFKCSQRFPGNLVGESHGVGKRGSTNIGTS